ncbi:hypothetical protein H9Y04_42205 [Streptomyces sp. TRM66268-LWL]|uniref:WXG100 family type VII secretion target n=1 Tax=Streptomyces polyasparticus TaxID=2767826 RepID=A0ABR7SUJ5_9ACTN|nr:hypothetical protein [Streptomyces polyasparticus]MBC9719145.1 hypothetical protein [Streptomyces polyasparticus]
MLTVSELTELRLGKLKEAVDQWQTMTGKLQRLADGKGDISAAELAQQANGADWSGVNATVTREFITKTTREFTHAAAEAKTILGLLSDIHHDFTKHKSDLKTALVDARAKNIRVHQNGSTEDGYVHSVGDGGNTDPVPQAELDAAAEKITRPRLSPQAWAARAPSSSGGSWPLRPARRSRATARRCWPRSRTT